MTKIDGYHDKADLPVKAGDRVWIPKGTSIRNLSRGTYAAGRGYWITVNHVLPGWECEGEKHNPKVCWPGTGAYWSEADINDVTFGHGSSFGLTGR